MSDPEEAAFEQAQQARFRARLAGDLERLRALVPRLADDPAALGAIEALAHGLAGAGGTFGFPAVSEQGEAVERLAEARHLAVLPAALKRLEAAMLAALAQPDSAL